MSLFLLHFLFIYLLREILKHIQILATLRSYVFERLNYVTERKKEKKRRKNRSTVPSHFGRKVSGAFSAVPSTSKACSSTFNSTDRGEKQGGFRYQTLNSIFHS